MTDVALGVRLFDPINERSWVIDSWKRSACKSKEGFSYSSFDDFKEDVAPVIIDLIETVPVYVVHLAEDTAAAVGWACLQEKHTLHYVFVKRRWRELGIARWFLDQLGVLNRPVDYTFRTSICEAQKVRGARVEPDVKVPLSWRYRKYRAWRNAS